ncbi:MAG TPA: saccharopine dehydrogenase C-terminal domain-containing protein [Anaerolineales bacterium]|jgi:saccharopine dehydrogenase-like NADP-dependent oxidoreductase|nr:saccharopine dehydrogenase C-terminal domain-containing protein [Anaerolineales bacterium]
MRALVLGGAGAVCKETTRDLSRYSNYDEIVVADFNLQAATDLIKNIGDKRLTPLFFDAEDYSSMLKLFPAFDVVVNGLPWKYDLPVTKACVEVGVNGLDVSTEEDQWSYDAEAKGKDVVFIPGVGATPGITNAMAKRAADRMDEVDDIQINFAAFRSPAPAPGLLITFLWEFHPQTESRVYYQDGEFIWAGPFEGLKMIEFPGQIGEQEVCYIPHPETRTMPKSLGAKKVSVRGCFPPQAMRIGKVMLDWGLYSDDPVTIKGIESTPFDIMFDLLLEMPETKQTTIWAYGLVVDVYGKVNGRAVKDTLWSEHPPQEEWGGSAAYYKNIAIPLSIGAQMITNGEVSARGVVPPESSLDPDRFFEELKKRGILVKEKFEEL